MSSKKYDIVAKVGEYTNSQGETKSNWRNVGAVMTGENGPFIMLDATFNPAGLKQEGRSGILLSLFEPKDRQQGQQSKPQQPPADDFDNDVPF